METTYDDIVRLQFEWFGFQTFTTKPLAIYKYTIGTFDVLDINLGSKVILAYPNEKSEESGELPFRLVAVGEEGQCGWEL